jgi:hypothetical protein
VDHHELVFSAFEQSIRQAATKLEDVAERAASSDTWYSEVRTALRSASLAIERHFGGIAGDGGLIEELSTEGPRLLGTLAQHEASLARLLVEVWDTSTETPGANEQFVERLRWLAGQLRRCANEEIALLYESFNEPPEID